MRPLVLALALTSAATAQPDRAWTASAQHGVEAFDDARAAWLSTDLSVERQLAGGALVATVGRAERYDQAAAFGGLDAYAVLAPKLYGNVRARLAPGAETVAHRDLLAELYAGLPGGLELSAGARRMDFAEGSATLLLGSATLFRPGGRLRARLSATPTDSATALAASLTARLDLDRSPTRRRSYVQVRGGRGQEVVAEPGEPVGVRTSWDLSVGGRLRVRDRLAVGADVGRIWDVDLSRLTARAGVFVEL